MGSQLLLTKDPEGTGFLIPCEQESQQENKPEQVMEQDLPLQM